MRFTNVSPRGDLELEDVGIVEHGETFDVPAHLATLYLAQPENFAHDASADSDDDRAALASHNAELAAVDPQGPARTDLPADMVPAAQGPAQGLDDTATAITDEGPTE